MNQIIYIKNSKKINLYKFLLYYILFFSISSLLICVIIICLFFNSIYKYNIMSKNLNNNYSIYKLYTKLNSESKTDTSSRIFGLIEIPKLKVNYVVFSDYNEELLKISPCRFYGKSPKEIGNLCIAGHNYNNSMFFSNLFLLNIDDVIYIYDNDNNKYLYTIFSIYEVNHSDWSPIYNYALNSKELTLVTCNNKNNNRLIVKAKQ